MHFDAPPENRRSIDLKETRGPELGPALKRDRLLQRVRAARRRLTPAPGTVAKPR
jgi:hypothetical protein